MILFFFIQSRSFPTGRKRFLFSSHTYYTVVLKAVASCFWICMRQFLLADGVGFLLLVWCVGFGGGFYIRFHSVTLQTVKQAVKTILITKKQTHLKNIICSWANYAFILQHKHTPSSFWSVFFKKWVLSELSCFRNRQGKAKSPKR